ncbi:MAG: phosphopantetheine-binding protein [Paracoccus sp. (in: a-proteobacteria)]|uniref:phosphopantetheine-binding protein n=1 Tax=Paracoccus sp. TaxID=267 RepID=UPI0026DEF6E3|nr:phosphopantetheine-binding protein [Paracoccus sp. (in: a-proteobacteria)]MDO5622759.1 phosphopantetheine-binding protein [Paracoccus sp. (in: a-proteobacteria)]
MTLTLERMRADVARAVHMDPAEIADDDHLPDLGLDSLRLMRLVLEWEEAGLTADFGVFAEYATLGEWWQQIAPQEVSGQR